MNRTERIEEAEIERALEHNQPPCYPLRSYETTPEAELVNETTLVTRVLMAGLEDGVIDEKQLLALDKLRENME